MTLIPRGALVALTLCAVVAPAATAATPRTGRYKCFQTFREVSLINGEVTYATQYRDSLILRSHGRYALALRTAPGRWATRSGRLGFHGGSLDSASENWHVGGRYVARGRTMPHATMNATKRYTIVLRDLRSDDSDTAPPPAEFARRQNASFWYCAR